MSSDAQRSPGLPLTPLQRHLDQPDTPVKPTPRDVLALAVRWFHAGRRLDVQALAAELGVSRVTLHRWIGTREQLLAEVMWAATDRALTVGLDRLPAQGTGTRVADLLTRWAADVLDHPGVQQLQQDEHKIFTRLTTSDESEFQLRLIGRVRLLLAEDRAAGHLTVDLDLDDLAYTAVRIVESFVHTRAITGEKPDALRAGRILAALLR